MKKITVVYIGVLLTVLFVLIFKNISVTAGSAAGPLQITSDEGPVSIAVTPKDLSAGLSGWNFEITLVTHSGSIDADLGAVSELVDDNGKLYKPVSWEGSPPGGHHRNGMLKFNSISPKPKSIELKITDIGGVSERNFKWSL